MMRMLMKSPKAVAFCFLAFGAAIFMADYQYFHYVWPGTFGVMAFAYGLLKWMRTSEGQRNYRAFKADFARLDVIRGEQRYLGSESEIIDWQSDAKIRDPRASPTRPIHIVALGRTKGGRWFEFHVDVNYGRTYYHDIKPISDVDARHWLRYDVTKYEAIFGKVEIA
jgi:hypothetical protein